MPAAQPGQEIGHRRSQVDEVAQKAARLRQVQCGVDCLQGGCLFGLGVLHQSQHGQHVDAHAVEMDLARECIERVKLRTGIRQAFRCPRGQEQLGLSQ